MARRPLQPSNEENLLTNRTPIKQRQKRAARSLAESRILSTDKISHSASKESSSATRNLSSEGSSAEINDDETISSRCRRMSRACRYEGSYAYNDRILDSISQNMVCCVRKTPVKSRASSKEQNTPVIRSSRRILNRSTLCDKNVITENDGVAQETPSKILASELTNKLSMSSAKKPSTFVITKNENLKMRLRKQLFSPKKIAPVNHEVKKMMSPPKKARHDKDLEKEGVSKNQLDKLKRLLHTCEVPEKLLCRESEYEQVRKFIEGCVAKNGYSQTMYICGVPGTGKTATVVQVIKKLKLLHNFKVSVVNAMELTDSKRIYSKIYDDLFPDERRLSPNEARRRLNDFLEQSSNKIPVIVVIDELDLLCKSRQEFVYDLLNWTEKAVFPVGIIAIANTFDLHERFLARRIISRMGTNRIPFQPYKRDEIESILTYRLQNCDAIQQDAVELTSRKVAAVSGDLRKALDIVRRAIQIAIKEKQAKIGIETVLKAIRESTSRIYVDVVSSLSEQSKIILRAALNFSSTGNDCFTFSELYETYGKLCASYDMQRLPSGSVYSNLMQMCSLRLLIAAPGPNAWARKLRFGISVHDVRTALEVVSDVLIDEDDTAMYI